MPGRQGYCRALLIVFDGVQPLGEYSGSRPCVGLQNCRQPRWIRWMLCLLATRTFLQSTQGKNNQHTGYGWFSDSTELTPLMCLNQNQIIKKERVFEVRKENVCLKCTEHSRSAASLCTQHFPHYEACSSPDRDNRSRRLYAALACSGALVVLRPGISAKGISFFDHNVSFELQHTQVTPVGVVRIYECAKTFLANTIFTHLIRDRIWEFGGGRRSRDWCLLCCCIC